MVLPSCVMVIRERRRQYGDFAGKKRNGFPGVLPGSKIWKGALGVGYHSTIRLSGLS